MPVMHGKVQRTKILNRNLMGGFHAAGTQPLRSILGTLGVFLALKSAETAHLCFSQDIQAFFFFFFFFL